MSISVIHSAKDWSSFHLDREAQKQLLHLLPPVMHAARWFGGKAYTIDNLKCDQCLPMDFEECRFYFFVVETN